ncbi:MAG: nucleotidyl transferase AbiEii/AbiGii toxin family protein [Candidatus Tectomicrobia bacterium]|uniref:Nucleotidyl transferase AbiEii/AbiGii toxin family protein n=1 Tax=Tectimicrobiota bacterium TaxID=2528274 RepID=A0A932M1S5_UNCTE|nr:nucleotidyl transferase AbiEii/AbiGii toxin family protein [Candidatus Tectomicrobia bacterium]
MIPDSEIRQRARSDDVEPVIVERDYVLGWVLAGCFRPEIEKGLWFFKGGTCLKKCYFPDYRFSQDLDFTLTTPLASSEVEGILDEAMRWAEEASGIRFSERPIRHQVVFEGTQQETHRFKVYYRGPHRQVGDQPSIKLDLTLNERVLIPAVERPLVHPYSDQEIQGSIAIRSYTLEEVLAEKIRAVSGQRRYALSRDLFDIHQLIRRGADIIRVARILREKCALKGVPVEAVSAKTLSQRKESFHRDWETNLFHLLPLHLRVPFEESWDEATAGVESVRRELNAP